MGKKIRKDETKAANAAKVVTEQDYNALLEKYQEATKRIDLMSKDSDELVKEIASLKSSIGSYKSANTRMKNDLEKCKKEAQNEVGRLMKQVEHYKALDKEGDELNEQKAARIAVLEEALDDMTRQRGAAIKDVEKANDLNATLKEQLDAQRTTINDLKSERDVYAANLDWYNALPWYRKIFVMHV